MTRSAFAKQTYAQQLAQQLEELIHRGQWQPGQRTPSIRRLSQQYAVSPRTVHQAMQELEHRHLLTKNTTGRFHVASNAQAMAVTPSSVPTAPVGSASGEADAPASSSSPQPRLMHIGMLGLSYVSGQPMRDEWIERIAQSADRTLSELGGLSSTRIFSPDHDPQRNMHDTLDQVSRLASQLDGAILFPRYSPYLEAEIDLCDQLGLPWVSINRAENVIHNFVATDNNLCGRIAGQCFLAKGMDRILILTAWSQKQHSWRAKVMGVYEAFIIAAQPTAHLVFLDCDDHAAEAGYDCMTEYLKRHPQPPQGIFGVGDPLCLGAMQACQDHGLDVPGDVCVIGSTGLQAAATAAPAMTVIAQPVEEIGQTAVDMLVRMIQTGERRLPGKFLSSELVLRQSFTLDKDQRQTLARQGVAIAATA